MGFPLILFLGPEKTADFKKVNLRDVSSASAPSNSPPVKGSSDEENDNGLAGKLY